MNDQVSLEFQYRPSRVKALGAFMFGCLGACVLVCIVLFADIPPATICGIPLNPAQTRGLLSAIASLSLFPIAATFLFVICSFGRKSRVIFDVDSVTLPKANWLGIPSNSITLPFDQIVSIEKRRFVAKTMMVRVVHRSGRIALFSNMFPKPQDFEKVTEILSTLSHYGPSEPSAGFRD